MAEVINADVVENIGVKTQSREGKSGHHLRPFDLYSLALGARLTAVPGMNTGCRCLCLAVGRIRT